MSVNEKMTAIADNIRAKTGGTEPLNLDQMADSIPDVYAAGQSSMVDSNKLIPKTVSGSYISVDDVSEIPHSVKCKVESVNLFNNPTLAASGTSNGITWTLNEDKSVTLNGKATAFVVLWYVQQYISVGTYTLSGVPNMNGVYLQINKVVGGVDESVVSSSSSKTFELTDEKAYIKTFIGIYPNYQFDNFIIKPMLNRGATALPYTPYIKPEEVKVTRCGTNIVDILNGAIQYKAVTIREKTKNTLVLSCTGTYKGICYILPNNLVGKYLTISGEWDNANGAKGCLRINWIKKNNIADMTSTHIATYTSGATVSRLVNPPPEEECVLGLIVFGNSDGSIDGEGVVSYRNIQVEVGNVATAYEPYTAQTFTPSIDGTVEGMKSVSPYMNVFTDNAGATLETTYRMSWGMQEERERFYNDFQQGKINVSISFEWLALDKANITSVVNALSATTTGQTLTLKLSAVNTAFETSAGAADGSTSAEFAALVATKTNWTITMI